MKKIGKFPSVAFVIVNWNGLKDTIECLNSIKKIDYKNYKIILIDNGSDNDEAIKIKKTFPNILLIKNKKNMGFTGANNQGMRKSIKEGFDYSLLLNNDTIVTKDFLNQIVTSSINNPGTIFSPTILYPNTKKVWSNGGLFFPIFGLAKMIDKGKNLDKSKFKEPDFLTGCCILLKNSIIKRVGFFDDYYFAYLEDVDLSCRLKKLRYSLKICDSSIIFHKKSSSAGIEGSNKLSKLQAYFQTRNTIHYIKKFHKQNLIIKTSVIFFRPIISFLMLKNKRDYHEIIRGIKDGI